MTRHTPNSISRPFGTDGFSSDFSDGSKLNLGGEIVGSYDRRDMAEGKNTNALFGLVGTALMTVSHYRAVTGGAEGTQSGQALSRINRDSFRAL